MRGNRRSKETSSPDKDIVRLARIVRKILRVDGRVAPNLLEVLDVLKTTLPRLKIKFVPESLLPDAEARAYPKSWLIKFRSGLLEGLLRGEVRARWTFAHELGHVILQHPKRPFRKRDYETLRPIDAKIEREAHLFAAEFLAPIHLVRKYTTAEQIRSAFHLSHEAAENRLKESKLEELRNPAPHAVALTSSDNYLSFDAAEQVAVVFTAISTTIAEARSSTQTTAIEPLMENTLGAAILVAKSSRLLLDAYESFQRNPASHKYKIPAALMAAIHAVRPIRDIGAPETTSSAVRLLNHTCAIKAAFALMKLPLNEIGKICVRDPTQLVARAIEASYLKQIIEEGEKELRTASATRLLQLLPDYSRYNKNNDVGTSNNDVFGACLTAVAD